MQSIEPPSKRRKKTASKGNYDELFAWLGERGAKTSHLTVESDEDAGDCVKLTQTVAIGQPLVIVPHACVLTAEKAWACELGSKVKQCGERCSNELMLCLFMAQARASETSSWSCYLASLPETADIPATWEQDRLDRELKGTPLHSIVMAEREATRSEFAAVSEALGKVQGISWDGVLWALSMFRSRSFPGHLAAAAGGGGAVAAGGENSFSRGAASVGEQGGTLVRRGEESVVGCMVPLLDLLNHRHNEART